MVVSIGKIDAVVPQLLGRAYSDSRVKQLKEHSDASPAMPAGNPLVLPFRVQGAGGLKMHPLGDGRLS